MVNVGGGDVQVHYEAHGGVRCADADVVCC